MNRQMNRFSSRSAAGLLVLAATLAWPVSALAQPASGSGAATSSPAATPAAAPAGDDVKVALVDAGSKEGRREIKYAPKSGDEFGVRMTRSNDQAMTGTMGESAMKMPKTRIGYTARVSDAGAETFTTIYELGATTVDPSGGDEAGRGGAEQMKAVFTSVSGMKIAIGSGVRGNLVSEKITPPAGAPAGAQDMLSEFADPFRQITLRLPTEPIGVGGKWTVTSKLKSSGMNMTQVVTFTVKSLKDNTMNVDFTIAQAAEPQKIDMAGLPAGASLKLVSHKADGTGTAEIDFTRPVPVKQSLKTKVETKLQMDSGPGQPSADMTMKVDSEESVDIVAKEEVASKSVSATPPPAPAAPASPK